MPDGEAKRLEKSLEKSKSVLCSVAIPLQLSYACLLLAHTQFKLSYMAVALRKVLFLLGSHAQLLAHTRKSPSGMLMW